jgi:hypothetical protein
MTEMLEREEWLEWQKHPGTKALFQVLSQWEEELKARWSRGEFTDVSQYEAAIVNAKRIGQCEIIHHLLNMDYEQVVSVLSDD